MQNEQETPSSFEYNAEAGGLEQGLKYMITKSLKTKKKSSASKKQKLPFLTAALFCEKVINEGGVLSAIRIVNDVTITTNKLAESGTSIGTIKGLNLFLSFRKGDAVGEVNGELQVVNPTGKREKHAELSLAFDLESKKNGSVNAILPVSVTWDREGTYWFELHLEKTLITKIPLTLKMNVVSV